MRVTYRLISFRQTATPMERLYRHPKSSVHVALYVASMEGRPMVAFLIRAYSPHED